MDHSTEFIRKILTVTRLLPLPLPLPLPLLLALTLRLTLTVSKEFIRRILTTDRNMADGPPGDLLPRLGLGLGLGLGLTSPSPPH